MDEIDKIKDRIRTVVAEGRMSKREMARRAGIRSGALTGMERASWNPKAETMKALLRAIRKRPLGVVKSELRPAA